MEIAPHLTALRQDYLEVVLKAQIGMLDIERDPAIGPRRAVTGRSQDGIGMNPTKKIITEEDKIEV